MYISLFWPNFNVAGARGYLRVMGIAGSYPHLQCIRHAGNIHPRDSHPRVHPQADPDPCSALGK